VDPNGDGEGRRRLEWGDHIPTRGEVLGSQDYECRGIDGLGCKRIVSSDDDWMTVVMVADVLRGICRSCFAKMNSSERVRKCRITVQLKKAQLSLPILEIKSK